MKMFKKFSIIAFCLVLVMAMGGCKKKDKVDYIGETTTSTLTLNSDGTIREIACEDFTDPSYDISTLKEDIKKQIESYCEENIKDSVKLLQYSEVERIVKVAIDYKSMADYNDFNETKLRIGTLSDIPKGETFISFDDKDTPISLENISDEGYKVLFFDQAYNINVDGEVVFCGANSLFVTKRTITTTGEGEAIIIYKN